MSIENVVALLNIIANVALVLGVFNVGAYVVKTRQGSTSKLGKESFAYLAVPAGTVVLPSVILGSNAYQSALAASDVFNAASVFGVLPYSLAASAVWGGAVAYRHKPWRSVAINARNPQLSISSDVSNENILIWKRIVAEGDKLVKDWASMSTNMESILKFPLYANWRDPDVAALIKTVSTVRAERRETNPDASVDPWSTSYAQSVKKLRDQIVEVKRLAVVSLENQFTDRERERLETAQNLLRMVYSAGSNVQERKNAYDGLIRIMQELRIELPEEAKERFAIETKEIRSITAG